MISEPPVTATGSGADIAAFSLAENLEIGIAVSGFVVMPVVAIKIVIAVVTLIVMMAVAIMIFSMPVTAVRVLMTVAIMRVSMTVAIMRISVIVRGVYDLASAMATVVGHIGTIIAVPGVPPVHGAISVVMAVAVMVVAVIVVAGHAITGMVKILIGAIGMMDGRRIRPCRYEVVSPGVVRI